MVPATVVLAVGSAPLVAGLLEQAFGATAADSHRDVLATMALGLPGFSAYPIARFRGFYALGHFFRSWPTCSRTGSRSP